MAGPGRYFLSIVLRIQKIGDNKNPPHFIREIKTKGYDAIGVNVFHQKLMAFHPKKGVNGPYTTTVILFESKKKYVSYDYVVHFQIVMWPGVYRLGRRKRASGELPVAETPFRHGTIGVHVNNSLSGVVTGLTPWTVYTVAVAGYNNAGLGELYIDVITTVDSSKSVSFVCK